MSYNKLIYKLIKIIFKKGVRYWERLPKPIRKILIKKLRHILKKAARQGLKELLYTANKIKAALEELISNNEFDEENITVTFDEMENELKKPHQEPENNGISEAALEEAEDEIEDIEDISFEDVSIKLIFLSGDKVIFNNPRFNKNIDKIEFNEEALKNLREIVDNTQANIIITTSARKFPGGKTILISKLKEYNLDSIVSDFTPEQIRKHRKDKIKAMLENFQDGEESMIDSYIILDKREDLGNTLNSNLITCKNGIDNVVKLKTIKMLNSEVI